MKKHNKFFLIILILMFGVKMVSAQGVETDQKFHAGVGFSVLYSLKSYRLHTGYGGYFLAFFKEKAFYCQVELGYTYFRQEDYKDKFVQSFTRYVKGGVRLPGFEKVSVYLNAGAGVVYGTEIDYSGGSYQVGIKLLSKGGLYGMGEVNLNFTGYNFDKKNEEVVSLGFAYWLPVFQRKSKQ